MRSKFVEQSHTFRFTFVHFSSHFHYRPPTKLWEGNVFTRCLSFFSGEVSKLWGGYPRGSGYVNQRVRGWVIQRGRGRVLTPRHGTCRGWVPTPSCYWYLVAATITRTVGKRAVRILLVCFLVHLFFFIIFSKSSNWVIYSDYLVSLYLVSQNMSCL